MRRAKPHFCAISLFLFFTLAVSLCPAQDGTQQRRSGDGNSRSANSSSNAPTPREIRGYRVERADVRIRRATGTSANALVSLGTPRIASVTPLGVWLEVPVTIAAVEQSGQVEMLVFEDMRVGGTPVTVEEYVHPFRLPRNEPLVLPYPARIYLNVTGALLGATSALRETLPVTGRVYVCGRFRRFFLTFRRAVPVELNLSVTNPLNNIRASIPR